jgi:hypothetical protein
MRYLRIIDKELFKAYPRNLKNHLKMYLGYVIPKDYLKSYLRRGLGFRRGYLEVSKACKRDYIWFT